MFINVICNNGLYNIKTIGIAALDLARETESLLQQFPYAAFNLDEQRRFRAALYKPLLPIFSKKNGRA